jgi:hypothetical protein
MNWYHMIIGEENRLSGHFLADQEELFGRDWFDLELGNRIDDWNPESQLSSGDPTRDGPPDDVLANGLGLPVFSQRLVRVLTQGAVGVADVQYLPIRVARSTGEQLSGFNVGNVVARVPALDAARSRMLGTDDDEIDPLTGRPKVVSLGKAALKANVLDGHDIIRLTEFFPPVFVSQRIVDIFSGGKFTGVTFSPVPVS